MDRKKALIEKHFEYIVTKVKILYKQRAIKGNGFTLKYMLEKAPESDDLIVVFCSCPRPGLRARYNYNRTLKPFKVNKLFVLDDFGYDRRGAYYLGAGFQFDVAGLTKILIDKCVSITHARRLFFVGSSKGAWASLYFGLVYKNSHLIIGAPQYFLGSHLNEGSPKTLRYICGDVTEEKINILDDLIKKRIVSCRANNSKIFLHYSDKDGTYRKHIQYLIGDLLGNGYELECDQKNYENHSDVSLYFPPFLRSVLSKTLGVSCDPQMVQSR